MNTRGLPPGLELGLSDGDDDLDGIIALQRANLEAMVGAATAARDGFVTLVHRREMLAAFHAVTPAVVARVAGDLIGYAVAMDLSMRPLVPGLEPFFALLPELRHGGRPLTARHVVVVGQVCVAAAWRGRGVVDALYAAFVARHAGRYDVALAEVATRNARSLRTHARLGFVELTRYRDDADEWAVLALTLADRAT